MKKQKKEASFKFDPQAFLDGTKDMEEGVVGVYMRLLSNIYLPHNNGKLPYNMHILADMGKVSLRRFTGMWLTLSQKFDIHEVGGDRWLTNRRVNKHFESEGKAVLKRQINGVFGNKLKEKRYKGCNLNVIDKIKKEFNWKDFAELKPDEFSSTISIWVSNTMKRHGAEEKEIILNGAADNGDIFELVRKWSDAVISGADFEFHAVIEREARKGIIIAVTPELVDQHCTKITRGGLADKSLKGFRNSLYTYLRTASANKAIKQAEVKSKEPEKKHGRITDSNLHEFIGRERPKEQSNEPQP